MISVRVGHLNREHPLTDRAMRMYSATASARGEHGIKGASENDSAAATGAI
jgi:hypothetical protein